MISARWTYDGGHFSRRYEEEEVFETVGDGDRDEAEP